ncbi:MAG: tRNA (adenosine(37)-N6)-threonylcarbamoyltransferase complex dimerization subunit type 1 TsaB [Elusimicrobia bacterium]|jgi:tRNA threonylcarbamoyladenosine biosynthesis protein TsaB|nr:tRNA (adenosine(37)-N6)-threonylcarbamoyltransferase complex dimerization subunit type 1 TsaB [Elusimicrobiota bacterium]
MFLAIDTTTEIFTVALGSAEKVYASKVIKGKKHSDRLIPSIEEVIQKSSTSFYDVKAIGVCAGPGSFTGIRIGLSCALTMAQVLNIPVYSLSLLDIAGRSVRCPAIKAFGKKYYFAEYEKSGNRKEEIRIIEEQELIKMEGVQAKVDPVQLLKETAVFFKSKKKGKWTDIEPLYLMETKYRAKNAKH